MNLSEGLIRLTGVLEESLHARAGVDVAVSPLLHVLQTLGTAAVQGHRATHVATYLAGTGQAVPIETGERDVTAHLVAFVRTPPAHGDGDAVDGLAVVDVLLQVIPLQRWGLAEAHPAIAVEATDLHGLVSDQVGDASSWRQGLSVRARARQLHGEADGDHSRGVWAVTWEQTFRIGTAIAEEGPSERPPRAEMRYGPPARPRTIVTDDLLDLPGTRRADDAA